MKKVLLIAIVLVLAFSFVACGSSYGKIKSAFEKEGYKESEKLESFMSSIKDSLEEDELAVTVHYLYKLSEGGGAFIVEFNSTNDIKKALNENEALKEKVEEYASSEEAQELYDKAKDAGIVNGNCVCIPFGLAPATYIEIFKNA